MSESSGGRAPFRPFLHTCDDCGHTVEVLDRRLDRRPHHDRLTGSSTDISVKCDQSGVWADLTEFRIGTQKGWREPPQLVKARGELEGRRLDCFYCEKAVIRYTGGRNQEMPRHFPNGSAAAGYRCPGSEQPPGKITELNGSEEASVRVPSAVSMSRTPSSVQDPSEALPWWSWVIAAMFAGLVVFMIGSLVVMLWSGLSGGEPEPSVDYTPQLCEHLRYEGWGPSDSFVARVEYGANC